MSRPQKGVSLVHYLAGAQPSGAGRRARVAPQSRMVNAVAKAAGERADPKPAQPNAEGGAPTAT